MRTTFLLTTMLMAAPAHVAYAAHDLVITNGTVFDGTGAPIPVDRLHQVRW